MKRNLLSSVLLLLLAGQAVFAGHYKSFKVAGGITYTVNESNFETFSRISPALSSINQITLYKTA